MPAPEPFARAVLFAIGVIWAAVAAMGVFDPHGLAGAADITLGSAGALQEWRANYGGMAAMLAGLHMVAAVRNLHLRPGLLVAVLLMVGLLSGRALSLVLDGPPGVVGWMLAGTEVIGITVGLLAWRRLPA